jgi:succinate dehydrogenase/fumarate reductase flavoprotein subunit
MVCKGLFTRDGCSSGAGVFTVVNRHTDPNDTWKVLFEDMLRSGGYMNNQRIAERHSKATVDIALWMEQLGLVFQRQEDGRKHFQVRYGGHAITRTGNLSGYTIMRGLADEIRRRGIRIFEEMLLTKLLTSGGTVVGAVGIHMPTGCYYVFRAPAVVIASGGNVELFHRSGCPVNKTGDGIHMAYQAGAELIDMEFFQFHPLGAMPTVRGMTVGLTNHRRDARFYNNLGERFMRYYAPQWLERCARDFVSRCEFKEAKDGRACPLGGMWLSQTHNDPELFISGVFARIRESAIRLVGFDVTKEPAEVFPRAHYTMGGIRVNINEETNIPGLYAAGEVAGGTHGGNRLGSNSLPAIFIEGKSAGKHAGEYALKAERPTIDAKQVEEGRNEIYGLLKKEEGKVWPQKLFLDLQHLMWDYVGIERDEKGLKHALNEIGRMKKDYNKNMYLNDLSARYNKDLKIALEVTTLLTNAEITAEVSLFRTESRAAQFRLDYPNMDDENWFCNVIAQLVNGEMTLRKAPVEEYIMTKAECQALGYYDSVTGSQPDTWAEG